MRTGARPTIVSEREPRWVRRGCLIPNCRRMRWSSERATIPAVTHTDGTARPQGVTAEGSPRYYRLIRRFGELTGVPVLLNTSFNVQEPIVCSPEDALATFRGCDMNY